MGVARTKAPKALPADALPDVEGAGSSEPEKTGTALVFPAHEKDGPSLAAQESWERNLPAVEHSLFLNAAPVAL